MRRLWAGVIVVSLSLMLSGCAGTSFAEAHPAARAVTALLKARAARSTDVRAYRPYVSESSVATELATAASETATHSPIPEWRAPYVSAVTTATADVVVVWIPAKAFAVWPAATDFKLERLGGSWVVTDAVTLEAAAIPKPLATPKPDASR